MTDAPPFLLSPGPHGLAFLELGERLRQRGQFDAAATVALAGLGHYPMLADAHDLLGRIRAEQGDDVAATASWQAALECTPGHVGARKGLAFIAFRAHDFAAAERHLELAVSETPHDASLQAALDRVRRARPSTAREEAPRLDDPASGFLLFDGQGMRLIGGVGAGSNDATADATAAEAAGLSREAGRAARLLGLGSMRHLIVEGTGARFAILAVADDASLLVRRSAATPVGRLLAVGTRAAASAREWLGRLG